MEPIASLITDYVANGSFASLKANVRTYKEKNYALFVRTVDFANNFKGDLSYIDKESYDFLEKSKLYGGELMLSNIGASIGKVFKVPHLDTPMSLAPNAIILRFFNDITCDYFEYVFKSFVGQNYLQFLSGGAAMPKFNKTDLRAMIVPVPPIKEQERIVESVKNTFIDIDDLDISYSGLANTIQSVKSKILDLAIRGKLVPQDPNDEPASVLLERIQAEKEELIKQGKIKRDKKESVIFKGDDNSYYRLTSDNKRYDVSAPFDLPDCWEWTTFPTVAHVELGKTLDKVKNTGTYYPYLRSVNVQWGYVDLSDVKEMKFEPEEIERYTIKKNDLLICEGGDVGRCCVWNKNESILYQNAIHRVRFYNSINCNFYMYFMMYLEAKGTLKRISNGVTIKHLTNTVLSNIIIPLPPLAEQERIVNAVETLFTQIDKIAEQIS